MRGAVWYDTAWQVASNVGCSGSTTRSPG